MHGIQEAVAALMESLCRCEHDTTGGCRCELCRLADDGCPNVGDVDDADDTDEE